MLTEQRQQKIMTALDRTGVVQLRDLVKSLAASESTVRRDLADLEAAGRLQRIHGGAQRRGLADEPRVADKAQTNAGAKTRIAAAAQAWLHPGMQVFIDAGTTTGLMAPLMPRDVTVVTNGVDNAKLLADAGVSTVLLGGRIKPATLAVVGGDAVQDLARYRFDLAFLGTNGIDQTAGFTTPDPEEAAIKRQAMSQSATTIVLADASKFGVVSFAQFAALAQPVILTADRHELPVAYQSLANLQEAKA